MGRLTARYEYFGKHHFIESNDCANRKSCKGFSARVNDLAEAAGGALTSPGGFVPIVILPGAGNGGSFFRPPARHFGRDRCGTRFLARAFCPAAVGSVGPL